MKHGGQPYMTIEKWFFILLTTFVLYLFWAIIEPFSLVLIIAVVAAIILSPLDRKLSAFLKHKKLSAAIISVGTIILVFVPLVLVLLVMVRQASDVLQESLGDQGWLLRLQLLADPILLLFPQNVREILATYDPNQFATGVASWAVDNIGSFFASTTKLIINTFLFFIALYYFILERDNLYKEAVILSPFRDSIDHKILKRIIQTVRSVVFGILILAVIQGIFAAIGMSIFGVPGALIWGAATIVAALVPFVGSALILVPAVLYLFFTGSTGAAFGLLIWGAVVVGLADNFLGPYLIKGTTHMHTFLVLLAVLGGLQAFGYIGIIAGPTILAALLALLELYKSGILADIQTKKVRSKK